MYLHLRVVAVLLAVVGRCFAETKFFPQIRAANIEHGIVLHYIERGEGVPVIFVHGSLSDFTYWDDQVPAFAKHHRAIAYSRRYNYPNHHPARPGYSAVTDADDLAAFIRALGLGKTVVVGRSYGALAALFLAARHPELLWAMVLAEPPAVSLLRHLAGDETTTGEKMYEDIQRRMLSPVKTAFRNGNRNAGIADFIDYVLDNPHAWREMPESAREETLRTRMGRNDDHWHTVPDHYPADHSRDQDAHSHAFGSEVVSVHTIDQPRAGAIASR